MRQVIALATGDSFRVVTVTNKQHNHRQVTFGGGRGGKVVEAMPVILLDDGGGDIVRRYSDKGVEMDAMVSIADLTRKIIHTHTTPIDNSRKGMPPSQLDPHPLRPVHPRYLRRT